MATNRKVNRVIVMLEYAEGEPAEVYDLTALATDMRGQSNAYSSHISLQVGCDRGYSRDGPSVELNASWSGYVSGGGFTSRSSHLEDVLNCALPDGPRVEDLLKKVKRYRKKADQCEYEAKSAKMEQVAAVRHLHPVAHVTKVPSLEEFSKTAS